MNSLLTLGTKMQIDKQVRACAKCRYSQLETMPGQIQRVLVCHRFPPVMSLYTAPGPGGQMGVTGATNHPVVLPISWCYEFAPAEVVDSESPTGVRPKNTSKVD